MAGAETYEATQKTKVKRQQDRGKYDVETVHGILKEGLVAHVAFVKDSYPVCLPMAYARREETLYLHGSITNSMLKTIKKGELDICVTVTLLDGIVVARSAFHHSLNYRSVVAYGKARAVDDPEEKLAALDAITEHILPGRTAEVRPNNKAETNATLVLALDLLEVSAKVRTGPGRDDEKDYRLPNVWAGVLPFAPLTALAPIDDPRLISGIPQAKSVLDYKRHTQDPA